MAAAVLVYRSNNGVPALWPTFRRKPEDFLLPDLVLNYVKLKVVSEVQVQCYNCFEISEILGTIYTLEEISDHRHAKKSASTAERTTHTPFTSKFQRSLSDILFC